MRKGGDSDKQVDQSSSSSSSATSATSSSPSMTPATATNNGSSSSGSAIAIEDLARRARSASHALQSATAAQKSAALRSIHAALQAHSDTVLAANRLDLDAAAAEVATGKMSQSLLKRLDLGPATGDKYQSLLQGVLDVEQLPDPTGQVELAKRLDEGLDLYRVSTPIGVLLIIFEARPEVVIQISCLAIKSGNAVILKGGKEASRSNGALYHALRSALAQPEGSGVPADAVQLVETRTEIDSLLKMDQYIDLVIPRGSNQLVRHIQSSTRIPVLGHADGLCATYIDASADVAKTIHVVIDAKTSYPAACNSTETILFHASLVPSDLFVKTLTALLDAGVSVEADPRVLAAATAAGLTSSSSPPRKNGATVSAASPDAFDTEFLTLRVAVAAVDTLDGAIAHINAHGSRHTDAIVTEDAEAAEAFMRRVDAAGVFWNASTRFADGFRYGFGAEIGVSTNKTHARGPVGLEGLVIYKYRLYGSGQGTLDYGEGKKRYLHQPIAIDDAVSKKFRQ
ncbi:glutamate-5-semialdehyde dehydrogenase [Zopfochytrium polystomum]|nr:glutamate-5-semialdehyde dehydrogenase [Zopfochytrium polystomum]